MAEKKIGVRQVSKKVAASVLAGIMATSMVPAAAFAEGVVTDTTSDNGTELQSLTPDKAFSAAKLVDGSNHTIDKDYPPIPVNTGTVPTIKRVVIDVNETTLDLSDNGNGTYTDQKNPKKNVYTITYQNEAGTTVTADAIKSTPGIYKIVVTATEGDYKGGVATATFVVAGSTITATPYNKADDSTTFTYSAEQQQIGFKNGTDLLEEGKDYTVRYFKEGADYSNPAEAISGAPIEAGKYNARLTGLGRYNNTHADYPIVVDPLDLSSPNTKFKLNPSVVVGTSTPLNTVQVVSINKSTALASKVMISKWSGAGVANGKGDCIATINAMTKGDKNFKLNSAKEVVPGQASVVRVANAATINYAGKAMNGQSVTLDSSKGEKWYKNNVRAFRNDGTEIDPSNIEVRFLNEKGNAVNPADPLPAGTYTVIATIKANSESYEYGGEATMTVRAIGGTIDADTSAIVSFEKNRGTGDYVVTNAITATYDGNSMASRIKCTLYDGKKPIPTAEYKLIYTDSKGNEISDTELKNAGSYTLTIKSDKYQIQNPTVPITIEPIKIQTIKVTAPAEQSLGNGQTGIRFDPTDATTAPQAAVTVKYSDSSKKADGTIDWKDLPLSLPSSVQTIITDSKGAVVDKFNAVDTYKVSVVKKHATDTNIEITAPTLSVVVADAVANTDFADVINPDTYHGKDALPWYCKEVYKAKKLGYMHGYIDNPDTTNPSVPTMFKPEQSITRAEFARVLYNMAGNPSKYKANETENGTDKNVTNTTNFSDCDDSAWYARAVSWAHATGIVKGYDGTTEFRPDQAISRQEVAMMVSRYKKYIAPNQYKSGEGTSLSSYLDSFAVDGWAQGAVQWAVANKVMGVNTNLLSPRNDITRAEVAAMSVRAQPVKLGA